jgi:hypothetical protein
MMTCVDRYRDDKTTMCCLLCCNRAGDPVQRRIRGLLYLYGRG